MVFIKEEKYYIELKILLDLQSSNAQSVQLKKCSQIQLQWFCAGNLNLLASCFVVAQITFCTLHLSYTCSIITTTSTTKNSINHTDLVKTNTKPYWFGNLMFLFLKLLCTKVALLCRSPLYRTLVMDCILQALILVWKKTTKSAP